MLSIMSGLAYLLEHGTHPFIRAEDYHIRCALPKSPKVPLSARTSVDADAVGFGPKYDYTAAAAAATTQNGASASAPGPDTTTQTAITAYSTQESMETVGQMLVNYSGAFHNITYTDKGIR